MQRKTSIRDLANWMQNALEYMLEILKLKI